MCISTTVSKRSLYGTVPIANERKVTILFALVCGAVLCSHAWGQELVESAIVGIDENGFPMICGTENPQAEMESLGDSLTEEVLSATGLDAGQRGWECIPGVIRNDGVDGFMLEVDTNGPVNDVTLVNSGKFTVPGQSNSDVPVPLHDDGLNGDRVAGDEVFTIGPIRYPAPIPTHQGYPDGLAFALVANVLIEEIDGTVVYAFLRPPEVGLMRPDVAADADVTQLCKNIQSTPHLLNIKSSSHSSQKVLRAQPSGLEEVTKEIYTVLPDSFDFFVYLSTNKVERTNHSRGGVVGRHRSVQVNYTGTGRSLADRTEQWGSAGKLLSVNITDIGASGANTNNITHEIMHQWASWADSDVFEFSDRGGHYSPFSNVGSVLGGFLWMDNLDGTHTLDCDPFTGASGLIYAPPLDRYMMGLIDGALVPNAMVYDPALGFPGQVCTSGPQPFESADIVEVVSIEDIQSVHGVRTPGPADAQRDFRIAFIAESHERFLTDVEMTFYEILAQTYGTSIPDGEPTPRVASGMVPIERFFGEGTTWNTEIVEPNEPPVPSTGGPYTVECRDATDGSTKVTLDGSGSSDPDGDALSYMWMTDGGSIDDASSESPTLDLTGVDLGMTFDVTLMVDDGTEIVSAMTTVMLEDTVAPMIVCPAAITLEPTAPEGNVVSYTPLASDACDADVDIVCDVASGSIFPVGSTTRVTCTATDDAGNKAECSFTVTILSIEDALDGMSAAIDALEAEGTLNEGNAKALQRTLRNVSRSLERGKDDAACSQLVDFLLNVQEQMDLQKLNAEEGGTLISSALNILDTLGC